MKLTKGQKRVLIFIARYTRQHGYSPTFREIATHISATSSNSVHCFLVQLAAKGAILRGPKKSSRTITLTEAAHAYLESIDFGYLLARQAG